MSLKRKYIVVCDKCGTEFGTGATPKQARQRAALVGWTRIKSAGRGRKDGQDRCPKHPQEAD